MPALLTATNKPGAAIQRALNNRGFPAFEKLADVTIQQNSMLRRMRYKRAARWECLRFCGSEDVCRAPHRCQAACLIGNWFYRGQLIAKVYDRLISDADSALHVTIVKKAWIHNLGSLVDLKPASMHRWLQRHLSGLEGVHGLAYVDVSLNTALDSTQYWQAHIHAVLTGIKSKQLKAALSIKPNGLVPKPVMVKSITNGDLARVLAYATKPLPEGRVAYIAETGRQRQRYVRVPSRHLREHDQWRMSMNMPARLVIIGMRIGRNGPGECR